MLVVIEIIDPTGSIRLDGIQCWSFTELLNSDAYAAKSEGTFRNLFILLCTVHNHVTCNASVNVHVVKWK
jgi:hypothetical protein